MLNDSPAAKPSSPSEGDPVDLAAKLAGQGAGANGEARVRDEVARLARVKAERDAKTAAGRTSTALPSFLGGPRSNGK